MNYREWIPKTIKALRYSNGYTLNDLASRAELSISYISDIENARTLPTIETLDKLLIALGTTLVLKVEDDYVPSGYVWVSREALQSLTDIVGDIVSNLDTDKDAQP